MVKDITRAIVGWTNRVVRKQSWERSRNVYERIWVSFREKAKVRQLPSGRTSKWLILVKVTGYATVERSYSGRRLKLKGWKASLTLLGYMWEQQAKGTP